MSKRVSAAAGAVPDRAMGKADRQSCTSVSQPEPDFLYAHGVDGGDAAALVDVGGALDGGAAAAFRAVCDPPTFALGGFPAGSRGTFGVFNQTDADGAVRRYAIVSLVADDARARAAFALLLPLDGDGCPGTVQAPLVLPFGTLDDGNFGAPGFNPKTKAVTACQPEVYQAEEEEEGA